MPQRLSHFNNNHGHVVGWRAVAKPLDVLNNLIGHVERFGRESGGGELGETVLAELASLSVPRFEDPVRVKQQPVAGYECGLMLRFADQAIFLHTDHHVLAVKKLHGFPARTQVQRRGMSRATKCERSAVEINSGGYETHKEMRLAKVIEDELVERTNDLHGTQAVRNIVANLTAHARRQQRRADSVAGHVAHRDVAT